MKIVWMNAGMDAFIGHRRVAHVIDYNVIYRLSRFRFDQPFEFEVFGGADVRRKEHRKTLEEAQLAVENILAYWSTRKVRDIRARGRERRLRHGLPPAGACAAQADVSA